jgi:hypothetical protein
VVPVENVDDVKQDLTHAETHIEISSASGTNRRDGSSFSMFTANNIMVDKHDEAAEGLNSGDGSHSIAL